MLDVAASSTGMKRFCLGKSTFLSPFSRVLGALTFAFLVWLGGVPCLAHGQESGPEPEGGQAPSIRIADDMGEAVRKEAAKVGKEFHKEVRPLFKRTPLGFDLETIDRVRVEALNLPLRAPEFVDHIVRQSRLLGFVGSMLVVAFLAAVFYSLFGQRRVLERLERGGDPFRRWIPSEFQVYVLSALRILVASLIPLVLFGVFSFIQAFISYREGWFWLTGQMLKLWAVGALILHLLRESLTRRLLPVSAEHGHAVFRVARLVVLYILLSVALFQAAKTFRLPEDFLALLKFLLSLSVVFVSLLLLLKKNAILGLLPDLPYGSYRKFRQGLERYYFPLMFLTFLTGLLWCAGYQKLSKVIWIKTWAVAGSFVGILVAYHLLRKRLETWIEKKGASDEAAHFLYRSLRSLLLYGAITLVTLVTLDLLGLMGAVERVLSFPLVRVGDTPVSLWTLCKAVLILLAVVLFSGFVRAWLDYKVYPSVGVDEGLGYAINTFVRYLFFVVGLLLSLNSVGLDLRVLMVFAGAMGIGLGLGLQNMFANLAAGFSLVFGRLIRKGDWIQVGDRVGLVQEVNLRSTKVRTRDNVEYLVPNADLTSQTIINYTLSDPLVRVHVPVGVSYRSRPREVERILLEAALANENVSRHKKPEVWFRQYGESSIDFELLVWIDARKVSENRVKSDLYFAIFDALERAGVEIPFPQRDIHIRSGLALPGGCSREERTQEGGRGTT